METEVHSLAPQPDKCPLDLLSGVDGHGCEAMPGKRIPSTLPTINLSNLLHKNNFRFSHRPEYRHMDV